MASARNPFDPMEKAFHAVAAGASLAAAALVLRLRYDAPPRPRRHEGST